MTLINILTSPSAWPDDVQHVEVIDTHISWVILTGEHAYKIKKPVNFGFLDFATLEKRRHFCEEELRLNQRLAPDIYQSVIAISEQDGKILLDDDTAPIEYAVKMHQFASNQRLDQLLQQNRFELHWIDDLAHQIADFHQNVPRVAVDSPWGESDTLWNAIGDNFTHLESVLTDPQDLLAVSSLHQRVLDTYRSLTELISRRKSQGSVRECHGDLHLGNITLHQDSLRLFDCIEFNLQFRWIDSMSDMAFLLMDLEANGEPRWANRCINVYLESCGDYHGLQLLKLYKSYRAMVRAKVATLGPSHDLEQFRHYLGLAQSYSEPKIPKLYLMHGVSGTGKSHLSQQLLDHTGMIRVRSDVERKRIYRDLSLKGNALELYGQEMNVRTHNALLDITRSLLLAGYSVVVDATFIRERARNNFYEMANTLDVETTVIACTCNDKLIRARLNKRQIEGIDVSDADIQVMEDQLRLLQPLTTDEENITVTVDTDDDAAVHNLIDALEVG